jgi:hypothetical protein
MNDVTIRLDVDGFATVQCEGVTSRIHFPEAQFAEEPERLEVYTQCYRDYCEQFPWRPSMGSLGLLGTLAARGDDSDH